MFVMKQTIVYLAPFVLTTILALFQCVRRCAGGPTIWLRSTGLWPASWSSSTCCTQRWSSECANVFCRTIGGISFLYEVLDVECWKLEHISAFMMTSSGTIVFVMGFPPDFCSFSFG